MEVKLAWADKRPGDLLEYVLDWSHRLQEETIRASDFFVPDNAILEVVDTVFSDTRTTIWLAGGDAGKNYEITNRITTSSGRTMEQPVRLRVI